jgi:hypothetical protein
MSRAKFGIGILGLAILSTLLGCENRPLTPAEVQDQHRFEVGCRYQDAQGYEMNMPYCGGPRS